MFKKGKKGSQHSDGGRDSGNVVSWLLQVRRKMPDCFARRYIPFEDVSCFTLPFCSMITDQFTEIDFIINVTIVF